MIRAEWLKLRTVRGWVAGLAGGAAVIVLLGLLAAMGSQMSCMAGDKEVRCPAPPTGPTGVAVRDTFSFAHRALTGDGSITARVADFNGIITYPPPNHDQIVPGLVPWAKAGLMVKASTTPGSSYASVFLSGAHGVRMQSDYVNDTGLPDSANDTWLRLTRSGDTITGYASADGAQWRQTSSVRLKDLPQTVQIGLFVTSPNDVSTEANPHGGHSAAARFTQATASFDHVTPAADWTYDDVGGDGHRTDWELTHPPGLKSSAGVLTIAGSGDVAPIEAGDGMPVERILSGTLAALLPIVVVAALFGASEFRRGMLRTTLAASPRRHRVVAAKAVVIAGAVFVTGLLAIGVTLPIGLHVLRSHGVIVLQTPWWTSLRVVVGTALVLSGTALLAYGVGLVTRRAVPAVAAVAIVMIVPMGVATTSLLPVAVAEWILRVTPAAAFALQQSLPAYPQVATDYSPADGFYPLAPWAGFAVLVLYAAVAVAAGAWRLRRSDA